MDTEHDLINKQHYEALAQYAKAFTLAAYPSCSITSSTYPDIIAYLDSLYAAIQGGASS